jgi:hypothetical protein
MTEPHEFGFSGLPPTYGPTKSDAGNFALSRSTPNYPARAHFLRRRSTNEKTCEWRSPQWMSFHPDNGKYCIS